MKALAEKIAAKLAPVPGVVAVVLGGSRASGLAAEDSDLDLGIYYAESNRPSLTALTQVATELQAGVPAQLAPPGAWGRWVNGGGWLNVDGTKVDWIFRDLTRVGVVFDECLAGVVTCDYSLGHPHGFHNHYYLGEVHYGVPLSDAGSVVRDLKARLTPYPRKLRQALVEKYLYDAGFMLDVGHKSAPRGDVLHATGCLFRGAAALVQVVLALNQQFTMNEKQAVAATRMLPIAPVAFAERLEAVLAAPGAEPASLASSFDEMRHLRVETHALAPSLAYDWVSAP